MTREQLIGLAFVCTVLGSLCLSGGLLVLNPDSSTIETTSVSVSDSLPLSADGEPIANVGELLAAEHKRLNGSIAIVDLSAHMLTLDGRLYNYDCIVLSGTVIYFSDGPLAYRVTVTEVQKL